MCRPSTPPDCPRPEPHAPYRGPVARPRVRRATRQPGRQAGTLLGVRPHQAAPVRRGSPPGGYAIVTGHNLDDEAAVLMGNVLHWHTDYLARQTPMLPARDGFPKKAKPLVRLTERETAAYCVLRGIDYLVDECPMAVGNKHLAYKEQLNELERTSPGAKFDFYFRFLLDAQDRFAEAEAERTDISLQACERCGAPPTTTSVRSARSPNEPPDPSRSRSGANPRRSPHEPQRCVAGRRARAVDRPQEAALPDRPRGRRRVPFALGRAPARRNDRKTGRGDVPVEPGHGVHRHPPDDHRLRSEDARGAQVVYPRTSARS